MEEKEKQKVVKGQTVWLYSYTGKIIETKVLSVGRKYITLEHNDRDKFYIDTLRKVNSCGIPTFIILDLEEYKEKQYCNTLARKFIRFDWNKLNKDELDKVLDIVKNYL